MKKITYREIKSLDIGILSDIALCPDIQKLTIFAKASENGEAPRSIFNALALENNKINSVIKTYVIFEGHKYAGFMTKLRRANELHLSYSVAPTMRNRLIAETAVHKMIKNLNEEDKKRVLKLSIASDNLSSIRVAEKLGFQLVGVNNETKMQVFSCQ
ncbi:MAG: hypothetical protein COB76_05550 [Alphaproteobacteria bacterium]|nr:MAG: hypothetical protein COB76_05665 [Alphaproteobacteria bacterium]PCH99535.1 MAG: hypothetical protein COB76_05550 [Alphaproteobacteria bacterium]